MEVGGHTLDIGANSCAISEDFEHFLVHLGLEDKVIKATALSKKRFLFHDGKVVPVGGLKDIFGASWLSLKGKWRFATEPFRKRGTAEDESELLTDASAMKQRKSWWNPYLAASMLEIYTIQALLQSLKI